SSGGLRSVQYPATSLAPTREAGVPITRRVRSTRPCCTVTVSPACTSRAGLAGWALISTLPARMASVASARVLNIRIAQSHRSSRAAPGPGSVLFERIEGTAKVRHLELAVAVGREERVWQGGLFHLRHF